jgi:hypothetical protein
MALPFCLGLSLALALAGGAMAQPAAPASVGTAAEKTTEAEPWIEVPGAVVDVFEGKDIGGLMLSADPRSHGTADQIRQLLGVDEHAAWLMSKMLYEYLYAWADHAHSTSATKPGYTWELRIYPDDHADILEELRARAGAFLTPSQRKLFDLLCVLEMRDQLGMTSLLVHEEDGTLAMQMLPCGRGWNHPAIKDNPHCLMAQLKDIAQREVRPDPKDNPAPIDPAKLYTLGESLHLPLSLARKYEWSWGFITDDFSLTPLAKSLLTKEQAKALVTGMNAFLVQARTHERSLAKYETRKDGALVITVEPSPPATAQAQLQHVQDLLKQTLGDATVPYYLLEPGITKEVRQTFPCLTGDSKKLTHMVNDGVISFERKLGKDSHASKSNHVRDMEKHLLKDTTAAADQQKKE